MVEIKQQKETGLPVRLPIGIENFQEIRTEGFYYVDKTGLIKELLQDGGKVNLFTRPRRFGKSLNMSMLKYFFGYGAEYSLFDGLEISKERELCDKYLGKFPVISITLKGVDARSYLEAKDKLAAVLGREALRFRFLIESDKLSEEERKQYARLITMGEREEPAFLMPQDVLEGSLLTLSQLLYRHYGQKVVLLIDEYDVPLDKAERAGYYEEMVQAIRGLLGNALKTNDCLQIAVLTGCLRVASRLETAQESIFTGLNNFNVYSVMNVSCGEYFGFLDNEVQELLEFYNLSHRYQLMKEWYDGYRFGDREVYCPWDIINYCRELRSEPEALPKAYWINTSGNDIIRTFLQKGGTGTRKELEQLINGEVITKEIKQELTYRDLYSSAENIWSVMLMTGYLTQYGQADTRYRLAIPNQEIRQIFIRQVMEWFQEEARRDTLKLNTFCEAFLTGNAEAIEKQFNAYLKKTISVRDTAVRKWKKENFYHGILLGLLSYREDWYIRSNAAAGDGYSDILVEAEEEGTGIVIEVKYPDKAALEKGCEEALEQIEQKSYIDALLEDGMETIIKIGIACNKRKCKVKLKKEKLES